MYPCHLKSVMLKKTPKYDPGFSQFISVCPTGFTWFNQQSCVAIVQQPETKSAALKYCKDLNSRANLMMPKSEYIQLNLEQLEETWNVTSATVFIGLTKTDGYWYWDDGTSLFVRCKDPLHKN